MRKDLYGKDAAALQAAHDPMIDLARMIDAPASEARKIYSAQDEIKKQAYAEIAKARFAALKARAITRMRPLRCASPTERCADSSRTEANPGVHRFCWYISAGGRTRQPTAV